MNRKDFYLLQTVYVYDTNPLIKVVKQKLKDKELIERYHDPPGRASNCFCADDVDQNGKPEANIWVPVPEDDITSLETQAKIATLNAAMADIISGDNVALEIYQDDIICLKAKSLRGL